MFLNLYFWGSFPLFLLGLRYLQPYWCNWLLPLVSLALIFSQDMLGGMLLFGLCMCVYLLLNRARQSQQGKLWCMVGIGLTLSILLVFKYLPLACKGSDSWCSHLLLPLGISFLSFRLIHVLIEQMRGTLPLFTFGQYCTYVFFFPIWLAGPIQRFDEFLQDRLVKPCSEDVLWSIQRIIWGIGKAFLISGMLLPQLYASSATPAAIGTHLAQLDALSIWRYLLVSYLILYTDFSGYTDIAVGLSRLLGFKIVENFNFPFLAVNMSDYWRRWHMSLAKWCQSYIYMPVLARTRSPNLALYATFCIMGLWHAASMQWLLWGLHHATGVLLFRWWDGFARKRVPAKIRNHQLSVCAGNLLTLLWVMAAGAYTTQHGISPLLTSFRILAKALGL